MYNFFRKLWHLALWIVHPYFVIIAFLFFFKSGYHWSGFYFIQIFKMPITSPAVFAGIGGGLLFLVCAYRMIVLHHYYVPDTILLLISTLLLDWAFVAFIFHDHPPYPVYLGEKLFSGLTLFIFGYQLIYLSLACLIGLFTAWFKYLTNYSRTPKNKEKYRIDEMHFDDANNY